MKYHIEKNAAPTRNITKLDPLTESDRNSRNGTSGVDATLSSMKVKMANNTAATARIERVYDDPQACVSVPTMAKMSAPSPAVTVMAPPMSSLVARSPRADRLASVRYRSAAAPAATPMGILTNRTQRHEASAVRTPPRREPAAPPAPATALQAPSALASRTPENVVTMMVRVAGDRKAPPMPCTARALVSQAEFWARPPARLAVVKTANPNR